MRALATYVFWLFSPLLIVEAIASNGGSRGTTSYVADVRAFYCARSAPFAGVAGASAPFAPKC
ncbi:MAG: hypothetical protein JWN27_862 [Candidatus Eremiobacteraeota bacterium]|jgi:hypothetical protein|nr:hypothetical protein [Candidatus Eremiobacteraeota bacterium]